MPKQEIKIKGMHCRSCEILIADKLKEISGVKNVHINYHSGKAEIVSDEEIAQSEIEKAVQDAGYEIGASEKPWISKNNDVIRQALFTLVIFVTLYFILKALGFSGINFGSFSKNSGLLAVLVIGLTAGFSTCMAIVGGLVLGISARHAEKHPQATAAQKFRPHLFFNAGRIISYFILGGLIGILGKAFQFSGLTLGLITVGVGLVMLVLGLQLTELFPKLNSGIFTLPPALSRLLGIKKHQEKEYSHGNSFLIGALTFFLPCGFTQSMQLLAISSGNFWSGAMIMGVFALGTMPGLLGVGGFISAVKGEFAQKFFRFVGLAVVFLALLNLSNGFNLLGWKPALNKNIKSNSAAGAPIENGVQIVRMNQLSSGYKPNSFTVKKGIPVKWIVNSLDPGSCAASLYASKFNVRRYLQPGENIIEFTPQETGQFRFSCSMGMYQGVFNVVEDDAPKNQTAISQPVAPSAPVSNPQNNTNTQVIKATFNAKTDILPKEFTVLAGKPVRFEIDSEDNIYGCMSSVTIPGLVDDFDYLEKGKKIVFNFTPSKKGDYYITCSMGTPRAILRVK